MCTEMLLILNCCVFELTIVPENVFFSEFGLRIQQGLFKGRVTYSLFLGN